MPRFLLEIDDRVDGEIVHHHEVIEVDDPRDVEREAGRKVTAYCRTQPTIAIGVELSELTKVEGFADRLDGGRG